MLLSIIIPVYNEEKTIETILERVTDLKFPASLKKEIIVINDGSTDRSGLYLERWAKLKKIHFINKNKNQGKGSAIREGLKYATGDIMLIQDADLEYDPSYYTVLLEPIIQKKTKVVYGTRLRSMKLELFGNNRTPFVLHYFANNILSLITRVLYRSDITDMETGFKVFTKSVYDTIGELKTKKFDIEPELTAKILKNGFSIYEIDIKIKPRGYAEGKKIQWHDTISAVYSLVKYRFLN